MNLVRQRPRITGVPLEPFTKERMQVVTMLRSKLDYVNLAFAILIIAFFATMSFLDVGAQSADPTPTCWVEPDGTTLCISAIRSTLTPFVPTSTPMPPPTATPLPTATPEIEILPLHFLHLPVAAR